MGQTNTHRENTVTGDLARIEALADQGVPVARNEASKLQAALVMIAISWSGFSLVLLAGENPWLFPLLPVVLLVLDFLSGFVHWFFDTQVEPGDTALGRIAIDFLDHHARPRRTVDVGLIVSASRPAILVTVPLVGLALLVREDPAWSAMLFWTGVFSMWVPHTHKWAHLPRRSALVSWLQRSRLVISPADHSRHHRDHGQSFCVFTGWLNPLLDGSRFWRGMERLFAAARSA